MHCINIKSIPIFHCCTNTEQKAQFHSAVALVLANGKMLLQYYRQMKISSNLVFVEAQN